MPIRIFKLLPPPEKSADTKIVRIVIPPLMFHSGFFTTLRGAAGGGPSRTPPLQNKKAHAGLLSCMSLAFQDGPAAKQRADGLASPSGVLRPQERCELVALLYHARPPCQGGKEKNIFTICYRCGPEKGTRHAGEARRVPVSVFGRNYSSSSFLASSMILAWFIWGTSS